jgi:hypothetical protein
MTAIVWDNPGDRVFETGLDRGVLYLDDGSAIPWNGLTSISEKFNGETNPVYYEGVKINDLVTVGSFEGTLKAITYPEEFLELEGFASARPGAFFGNQPGSPFNLSYRTLVGNDVDAEEHGHKIHVLYNVTAVPSNRNYESLSDNPELVDFEWDISAVPEEVTGYRPTAHFILDSRNLDPWLLEEIEALLYGSSTTDPDLPSLEDISTLIIDWNRFTVTDNGDGTMTVFSPRAGTITLSGILNQVVTIDGINAVYLVPDEEVELQDTFDESELI